jgi:serine/threonine protein phosphatase PrpC
LTRGLGDFQYKKNFSLGPEDQIITANPDILVHHIDEEDEFLVLASDGGYFCPESDLILTTAQASGSVCLHKIPSTSSDGRSTKARSFQRLAS